MVNRFKNRTLLWMLGTLVLIASVGSIPVSGQADAPRYGGTLAKSDLYGDPRTLDPVSAVSLGTHVVAMHIFDGLVKLDERGVVVPEIAERWTISPNGKTYTFYLRRGVLFHDGTEVTAGDFKYQLERVGNPENLSPNMPRLAGVVGLKEFQEKRTGEIIGIKVLDKHTLQISLERPSAVLLNYLTGVWASAVPKRAVERLGKDFAGRPVGSGPFVFESWVRDSQVTLKKFDQYWRTDQSGNRLPYLDKVVFLITREMATVEAAFESGNLDLTIVLDPQYRKYKNHLLYRKYLIEVPELYSRHIGVNMEMTGVPWQDKRVRQALNHAIDRQAIANVVNHGKAYPATGFLPPTMPGHDPALKGYAYDPERAKRLLVEAGFPTGFTVKIISTDSTGTGAPVVEAVMGYLSTLGIRLQLEVLEFGTYRKRQQDGQFEWYAGSYGGESHPLVYLQRAFHSRFAGPAGNFTRYRNQRVDELLDRAAETTDTNRMINLIRQAERIIVDEAPWWFSTYNKAVVVSQPYVRGLKRIPQEMGYQPLEEIWFAWPPKRR